MSSAAAVLQPAVISRNRSIPLSRLGTALLALNALLALAVLAGFRVFGLTFAWQNATPVLVLIGVCFALWQMYVWMPGNDAALGDVWLLFGLLLLFGNLIGLAQYPAASLNRPLVDATLARADALLGIHVGHLTAWTSQHPWLIQALYYTYNSFLVQLLLPVLVLGFWHRNLDALWEYAFHFHLSLIVVIISLALWPTVYVSTYYGFDPIFDQRGMLAQMIGLRAHTWLIVEPTQLTGLISVPSFHTAGALIVTWAFRKYRGWFGVLSIINVGLIAATFLGGAHYVVDEIAAFVLVGVSLVMYRAVKA